jgi:NAD(P)-dependent dehydrogenase (short-subunit alcohol dehydrogenase family)
VSGRSRTKEKDRIVIKEKENTNIWVGTWQTVRHPHTNMAKAALNMLTRTSAEDLAKTHRIFMNSVDTGWINVRVSFRILPCFLSSNSFWQITRTRTLSREPAGMPRSMIFRHPLTRSTRQLAFSILFSRVLPQVPGFMVNF